MARKGKQWTFAFTIKWSKFLRPEIVNREEDVWQALWRSALAEFFGTLMFVFCSCGAVVASVGAIGLSAADPHSPLLAIAFGHGLTICFVIYAVGEISGGHVNPAVTWATLLTGRLSVVRFFLYVISQMLGALVGAATLRSWLPDRIARAAHLGCHNPAADCSRGRAFGAEVVFTFVFVFVVFATAVSPFAGKLAPLASGGQEYGPGKLTPLVLGLTIFCLHLIGVPITGASMNPARSFGPAIAFHDSFCLDRHWIYWVGPLVGATIAACISTAIFLGNPNTTRSVLLISRGREKYQQLLAVLPSNNDVTEYETKVIGDSSASIDEVKKADYKPRSEVNLA